MPRKQIWSGAVLAAVAAAMLSGCSLKASDGTPQSFAQLSSLSAKDAIRAATRAVAAHPSPKVHTVLVAPTATQTEDVVATFDEHPALQGTLAMSSGDPTDARHPTAQSGPAIPLRYADDVMYLKMGNNPQLADEMNGKLWLKMDLQAMAGDPKTAAFGATVLDNTSPSKGLTLLAAARDLHAVGAEQRGGVQTQHYAGALTGADATDPNIAGRTGLTQDDADVVGRALAQGAVTKLAYDVWLRADGLPVAMTFTETTPVGAMTGRIDYSDWGTEVAVAPIPDNQSADFAAIAKQEEAAAAAAAQGGADGSSGSGGSDASGGSDGSGTPSTPATPSAPSSPAVPSTPVTPSGPATPSAPSAPGTPSVPQTPTPTGPSSTGSASTSAGGTSSSSSSSAPSNTSTASSPTA